MSKKFDEEYLAAFEESTPDLWDRIESNIDENIVRDIPKTKKKNYTNIITHIALPIAALALAFVLIPMAMGRMGSDDAGALNMESNTMAIMEEADVVDNAPKNSEVSESYSEECVEECAEECVEEECLEECTEEGVEEASDGTDVEEATSTNEIQTVYVEGKIIILQALADELPNPGIQELGYKNVYVAKIIETEVVDFLPDTEIMLYTINELQVDNMELSVTMVEIPEGFLLVEIR